MSSKHDTAFDEDEDLFDFENNLKETEEDDAEFDIAEFLSTISSEDTSAVLDLAEGAKADAAAKPETDAQEPAATAAAVAPAHQVVVAQADARPFYKQPASLSIVTIGALLLAGNLFGVWATWTNNQSMIREVEATRLDIAATIARAQKELDLEFARLENSTSPRSTADLGPASFKAVADRIATGDHAGARRLLYSKLALLDRIPVERRSEAEAHALFLLAETDRAAADALVDQEVEQ